MIRLYRFPYSCYALKVQYLLEHLQLEHQVIDVPFGDRSALVALTGGRVVVPALEQDGRVITESRRICTYLLDQVEHDLIPHGQAAVLWAYADWCDSILEDVLFRLASPGIAARFATDWERALFIFVKERKFGTGCVQQWQEHQAQLVRQAQDLLQPTCQTLAQQPFLAGERLTLADLVLASHLGMVAYGDPELVAALSPTLLSYWQRVRPGSPLKIT